MAQQSFDPGLSQKFTGNIRRAINKDGSFNVRRLGLGWQNFHVYQHLVTISWFKFFVYIIAGYVLTNVLFAFVYLAAGINNLHGANASSMGWAFADAFFFSAHTLTTVGYGNMYPDSFWFNVIAAAEAMVGLLAFALGTGLLYGRFSRPTASLIFSEHAIIAPYQDKTALEFRVANRRLTNTLIDVEIKVLLMTVEKNGDGQLMRQYHPVKLERTSVYFLPLTWTVVHPIDETSVLYNKTKEDLANLQAEFMILLKGFDDTFNQSVHARYSYTHKEITEGRRFTQAFYINDEGEMVLEMDKIGKTEPVGTINI
ncbi:MAG TPA: ion channel [Candidatus Kapabacteria bacterium]|nr:ion channel [Candidatus Kapabacteria bacterium]